MQQQQLTAAQQIEQINKQLTQAMLRKEDSQAQAEASTKEIVALRNVMQGVGLGMQLQREADAARAPQAPPPQAE